MQLFRAVLVINGTCSQSIQILIQLRSFYWQIFTMKVSSGYWVNAQLKLVNGQLHVFICLFIFSYSEAEFNHIYCHVPFLLIYFFGSENNCHQKRVSRRCASSFKIIRVSFNKLLFFIIKARKSAFTERPKTWLVAFMSILEFCHLSSGSG